MLHFALQGTQRHPSNLHCRQHLGDGDVMLILRLIFELVPGVSWPYLKTSAMFVCVQSPFMLSAKVENQNGNVSP